MKEWSVIYDGLFKEPVNDYFLIDMKSFYASVECIERNLDPLTTELVVMSRADNTGSGLILASSPEAKKRYGITNVSRPVTYHNHFLKHYTLFHHV